jgi:hypothetical protein
VEWKRRKLDDLGRVLSELRATMALLYLYEYEINDTHYGLQGRYIYNIFLHTLPFHFAPSPGLFQSIYSTSNPTFPLLSPSAFSNPLLTARLTCVHPTTSLCPPNLTTSSSTHFSPFASSTFL